MRWSNSSPERPPNCAPLRRRANPHASTSNILTGEVWNINASIARISGAFADVLGAAFRQTAMLLVSLSVWYARRFIMARLETEHALRRSKARESHADEQAGVAHADRPRMLMMLDIDQFKVVNDTYGHAAGDSMLREVASLFRRNLREEDSLARLGGDEFAALMPDCDEQTAVIVAERLRQAVAEFQ